MMNTAFLFAGQGAQVVGMARNITQACPAAARLFERASSILGFDLANLCFNGPQDTLNRTDISQPALLVGALACWEYFRSKKNIEAQFCTGLSLGEYTALVYAGSLTFDEAVHIVKIRGELMQQDCDSTPSGMASVIGLDTEKVLAVCNEASKSGIICISNINSPGQLVISGEKPALELASKLCKDAGAKRVITLKVSGAYHSPVMQRAQARLGEILERTEFKDPQVPFVSSVTGEIVTSGKTIRELMARQVTSTVQWVKSIQTMISNGVGEFYEFGPGKVLSGLVSRIDTNVRCHSIEETDDIQ